MTETREVLERRARHYAARLGYEPRGFAVSKMKKPELVAHCDRLLTEIMIKDCIKDAEYKDRGKYESEQKYKALVTALIRKNNLTCKELFYWNIDRLVVNVKPASEYISISCRASVWTQYADASIVLGEKTYEVKDVNVFDHVQGI